MTGHRARSLWIGLWTALSLAGCGSDGGPDEPDGPNLEEFQVNTSPLRTDVDGQFLATGPDGGFMAYWGDRQRSNNGSADQVLAQRIDADGHKAGAELAVSKPDEFGTLGFARPRPLGLGPQGQAIFGFLGLTNCNPCDNAVFVRRFQSDGTPAGSSLLIDSIFSFGENVEGPSVGVSSDGSAVVVWSTQHDQNHNNWTVKGQLLAADGSKTGTPFVVQGNLRFPFAQVAVAPDGSFLVTWKEGGDDRAQRFTASASTTGAELVLCAQCGDRGIDNVAMAPGGGIISVRVSSDLRILMQQFSADGSRLGGEVQVNTTQFAGGPKVSAAPDGRFAVAWAQTPDPAGFFKTVQVQRFAADGSRIGSVFQANTGTLLAVGGPDIALSASGRLLATWVNFKSDPTHGQVPDSVRGRLFAE